MGAKILHDLIVIMVIICVWATTGLSKDDIRIHMANNLGPGREIDIYCSLNGVAITTQQVPDTWSCQWWFKREFPLLLQCQANTKGAKQLDFLGFAMDSSNSCDYDGAGNCDWNFTPGAVFQKRSGNWVFRFKWP